MEPAWPRISLEPQNIKEHATSLHEAFTQLHAVKGTYSAIPSIFIAPVIESTLRFLSDVTPCLAGRDTELATQIKDFVKQQLQEQREAQVKEHEVIKNAIASATAPLQAGPQRAASKVASWAQVAAAAGPPPGHLTPPDSALSSTNASTLTAYKGREVVVKLLDHGLAQHFRQLSATQLRDKINTILRDSPEVKEIKVAAAHQLKSGDITIITNSLDEATELQKHTRWVKGLGARAEVIRTTYGVIVHGIQVNTINMKDQQGTIQRVLADNLSVIPNAEITYIGWLTKESIKKRSSSIVLEFTRPEMANAIIYTGLLWEGMVHTCQLYDRSCRIKQCVRCYDYGHIGTQCSALQACGHCAGRHESRDCHARVDPGFQPKCTVCKGNHTAWNAACPARQKEMQRVEKAKQQRSHYWPAPPRRVASATNSHNGREPEPSTTHSDTMPAPARQRTIASQENNEPRVLRSTRRQQQRHAEQNADSHGAQAPTTSQAQPTINPIAPSGVSITAQDALEQPPLPQPSPGLALDYTLDADEWLQNFELNWPDAAGIDPTPILSTLPDIHTGPATLSPRELARLEQSSTTFDHLPRPRKGCDCEEHSHIYDDWPVQNAELIIGTCMRRCPYCSYQREPKELRKHIRRQHGRRNLTVTKLMWGVKEVAPGWQALPTTVTASAIHSPNSDTHV